MQLSLSFANETKYLLMSILSRFKTITTFIFDMDGVLTDGSLSVTENWVRNMFVRDGYAIQLAVKMGFYLVIISGSDSPAVTERLKRLGVKHVFMNIKDKETLLKSFMSDNNLEMKEMLFMGDDIPDYYCMKLAGLAACPADAVSEIKSISHYISPFSGGKGCVRDVIEKVLKLNNKWSIETSVTST